ncbi:hypothetical protein GAYE_SCF37G5160 [Galdieria yellowstonensis]|jgi:hypothetical protein|uniref:DUF7875 domain-containing protein n=1 Tax=Galdieria yellowstonensis TaxID=3028027 RepID=A0AAV9IIL7_9RHOD|nr:hypothetical protein GAYE_SCF37G5160 [Galdieria yellowstonensis]
MDSPSSQVDYLQQEEEEWFYDMPYTPIMRPDAASCTGVVRRIGIFTGVLSFFGSLYITNALYGQRANLGRYVRTGLVGSLLCSSAACLHMYYTATQCKPCNRQVSRNAAKYLPRFV